MSEANKASKANQPAGGFPLLLAEQVSFGYLHKPQESDLTAAPVIHNFSLSAAAGDFIAVVGPSGCGKTTLLKLLGGFLHPDEGRVLWRGEPLGSPDPSRVMVFQEFDQLFPWKRVWANVEFSLKHSLKHSFEQGQRQVHSQRVAEMLQQVGLYEARRQFPYQLSGGMKQRTALARALVCRPDMLLMDEPFGSLDAQKREELQWLLLRMWQQHRFAALFVTHDISEALFLADRIVVLPRPGSAEHTEIAVDLPRPRERSAPEFREYYRRIYGLL
ncbi:MAG: ABC transporter ATP-binding protein [Spirochaetaceae bacterium]|nr:ABC transporter ATP-binding protein [Spirochaetaceae bacterium]MCF7947146.1 ABC transporter ATP-binding protein [Spirochaetia bacterium]MCF7950011.1 ABC transporter ATP-binding protein [Spirochaetaceae bacterium]